MGYDTTYWHGRVLERKSPSSAFPSADSLVAKRSLIAALPVIVCFALPLVQIRSLFYLYDLVIVASILVLGMPRGSKVRAVHFILGPIVMIGWAVLIATASSLLRTGGEIRAILYCGQYLLALMYCYCICLHIVSGHIDANRLAHWVVGGALACAAFALVHQALLRLNPSLGNQLYVGYLSLSGFSPRFYELRYLAGVGATGMVRAMGTWDVPTTFGGMMALATAWLLLISRSSTKVRLLVFSFFFLAILASGSRHAWFISIVVFVYLIPGALAQRIAVMSLLLAFVSIWILVAPNQIERGPDSLAFTEQIKARFDRTVTEGFQDSSIWLRYVDGTQRFLSHAVQDPTILLFGFGLNTDKALFDLLGPTQFSVLRDENQDWGFVSNSWLLILRNMGALGLLGLVALFLRIRRIHAATVSGPLIVAALLFLADNYAVQVARCFFLLMTFVIVVGADAFHRRRLQSCFAAPTAQLSHVRPSDSGSDQSLFPEIDFRRIRSALRTGIN